MGSVVGNIALKQHQNRSFYSSLGLISAFLKLFALSSSVMHFVLVHIDALHPSLNSEASYASSFRCASLLQKVRGFLKTIGSMRISTWMKWIWILKTMKNFLVLP